MDVEGYALAAGGGVSGAWKYGVRPFIDEHPGIVGWGATLAVAGLYDAWAVTSEHQTMSNAFHEGVDHPMYRFLCVGALGILALHLCHGVKD